MRVLFVDFLPEGVTLKYKDVLLVGEGGVEVEEEEKEEALV